MLTVDNIKEVVIFQAFTGLTTTAELVNTRQQLAAAQQEISRLQKESDNFRDMAAGYGKTIERMRADANADSVVRELT